MGGAWRWSQRLSRRSQVILSVVAVIVLVASIAVVTGGDEAEVPTAEAQTVPVGLAPAVLPSVTPTVPVPASSATAPAVPTAATTVAGP